MKMKTVGIETEWLPLSKLDKWNAPCQRDLTSLQHDIAKNYDARAFGVLHVLTRDGKYLIVDGQNRVSALKLMGYNGTYLVPCINHGEVDDSEAAAIFKAVNNFKGLQAYNLFMAAVLRGQRDQCTIVEIVQNLGMSISPAGSTGNISAVRALEKTHRPTAKGEPDAEALARTLKTIVSAWGMERSGGLHGTIIQGLGKVYLRDKARIDDDEMVAKLARRAGGAHKLLGDARGMRQVVGGNVVDCVAELVVREYNVNRRAASKKLKPFRV